MNEDASTEMVVLLSRNQLLASGDPGDGRSWKGGNYKSPRSVQV